MHTMEGNSASLRKGFLMNAILWMNPEGSILPKREIKVKESQSGKTCNMRYLIELNLQR